MIEVIESSIPNELNRGSITVLIQNLVRHKGEAIVREAIFSDDKDKPYGRKILFQNNRIELLLTGWNPGYGCWPHTHGEQSEGIVLVLQGEGTFQTFSSFCAEKNNEKTKILSVGNMIFVPCGELHLMRNDGLKPLICLHVYWPRVTEMWIYSPNLEISWRVSSGGAWQPAPEDILEKRIKEEK